MHPFLRLFTPGRPGKDEEALRALLSRVNCNDRREPGREAAEIEETLRRARQSAGTAGLSLLL
ncbi:hypothetical protein GCM10010431_81440 [Streptomyces kunmingensis]